MSDEQREELTARNRVILASRGYSEAEVESILGSPDAAHPMGS